MESELKKDSLGLAQSLLIGVAGSAPTFSISATMSTLIAAVGVLAPASLMYSGLIMVGIVLAYLFLNAYNPNSGASYAWVSEVFGLHFGFFAGWALLVASALFMVSATLPAASATLLLFVPNWAESQFAVTLCAIAWLLLVTAVVVKGVGLTAKIQMIMTVCELTILLVIAVLVVFRFGADFAHDLSWQTFSLQAFNLNSFASGAVIALFFFWGWDVSLNLNEETQSARQSPGFGALGAVVIIIVFFTAFAAIVLLALSDQEISQSGTNVVFAVADKVLPQPWNYLAVVALMLSTIGTLETSILQFTRTMFSKSRDGLLHTRWAKIHQDWGTPYIATFLIATIGSVLLLASLSSKDVAEVMSQSINVIGVQAAYYYGFAGFACVWHFRREAMRSVPKFVVMFLWPLISSLALWWAACLTALSFNVLTTVIAVGSIALGFWPLVMGMQRIKRAQNALGERSP
jgi:amino acid transporter